MTPTKAPEDALVEKIARAMFDCYRGYDAETQEMLWRQARYGLMRQAERALEVSGITTLLERERRWKELLGEAQLMFALGVGAMTENGDKANQERCVREAGELNLRISKALIGEGENGR